MDAISEQVGIQERIDQSLTILVGAIHSEDSFQDLLGTTKGSLEETAPNNGVNY